ncbi:hypothetical protein PSEUBRA_005578 [Kalmanozyma brasiliensis GHG001]|uniref:Uncharacterized protein n=1 Tax=Kalmanozyma brasiliensis (strain GHG001) TaxID=1365824 RepID=V5EQT9_KALBG|nr:uncharacterized protein PSEUBRA_005578 [Kalmanozyma brasiliensis GHG001]EST05308.1 hypothetical protein PSEUBRA_005578 [Kalmanozyma brasiliensis GHG001]
MSLQRPSDTLPDSVMAQDESMRDDSSARKYNKTSHLQQRPSQLNQIDEAAGSSSAARFIPAGDAGQPYDPVAEYRRGRALTADNLERIPNADQLAPGIRLPGRHIDPHAADTDMQTSSDADGGAQSLETGHTSVGAFGEGGAPVPGVPPELDPRTPAFRPHSPGEASVFSVAVQPPASPKASILEPSEPVSPFVEPPTSRSGASDHHGIPASSASATAGSSAYSASARGSSPPLSAGYAPSEAFNSAMRLGPGPSMLGRNVASVAPSEAGSVSSTGTGGGGPGSTGTADDQEVALRAAYIERQRMRERELMGGEAGVGGTTIPSFALPARGSTPLAFAPGLSARLGSNTAFDNVSRAGSTAATTGTSTPPLSPTGSDIPYAVGSPSRRGSVDSTETLGSMRAPPSVQGFELGSGIESRRMSRGGSSVGGDAHEGGRRMSEGGAMDEDLDASRAREDEMM